MIEEIRRQRHLSLLRRKNMRRLIHAARGRATFSIGRLWARRAPTGASSQKYGTGHLCRERGRERADPGPADDASGRRQRSPHGQYPGRKLRELNAVEFKVSADQKFVLLISDVRPRWGHVRLARYHVYDVTTRNKFPLSPVEDDRNAPLLQYAEWSPAGAALVFVHDNDIYYKPKVLKPLVCRITNTGVKQMYAIITAFALFDLALPLWALPTLRARRRQDASSERYGNIA
ncbi:Probable dipeptidyl-aminopeptidase B [Eumeta japonica]|uniref:Probable dipeptidyl-aminopeptidase B n=1 Tax=Eumeta variegata TaxID=151549 RepID=A0A4C1SHX3_EUMVA|nr:Probable dipeptidyl-aminopeptidase B [Eumeta japonica]